MACCPLLSTYIMASPPAWTSSDGMLSTPVDVYHGLSSCLDQLRWHVVHSCRRISWPLLLPGPAPMACCPLLSTYIMASPPAWTSSDGMLSTPVNVPFFTDFTAASTSSSRMVWLSLLVGGGTSIALGSPFAVCVYDSEQYCVYPFRMSCSSVRQLPALSWMVGVLSCFELVGSFTSW